MIKAQEQHHTPASSQIEHEEFVDKKDADTDEDLILFTSPVKTTDVPRKLKQQTKSSAVRKVLHFSILSLLIITTSLASMLSGRLRIQRAAAGARREE
jgi:hypothetical protein